MVTAPLSPLKPSLKMFSERTHRPIFKTSSTFEIHIFTVKMTSKSNELVEAINCLSQFLSHEEIRDETSLLRLITESTNQAPHVIVLCASAILSVAENVLSACKKMSQPGHPVVLVLCGGFGHSTQLMQDAIAAHPRFHTLADQVKGFAEARMLEAVAREFYAINTAASQAISSDLSVLVEDESTNCGSNASNSRRVLEKHGVHSPQSIIIAQDPTMSRRTKATFEKVYAGEDQPRILSWPTFVPQVMPSQDAAPFEYSSEGPTNDHTSGLWNRERFLSLLVGEIPRLRDDADGYGPKGRAYIGHVEIPDHVEAAWRIVSKYVEPRIALG